VKLFNAWQSAQATLAKKRETEVKLQTGGKPEKIAQIKQEIKDVREGGRDRERREREREWRERGRKGGRVGDGGREGGGEY
jgi:hypothetical protein